MMDLPVLRELTWVVVGAAGALLLARAVRLPSLVAYMLAGLLLGPVTGLVAVSPSVDRIAEVGIALLLFLVGLELSLGRIRDIGRVAVLAGGAQMLLTAGGGFGLAVTLGFTPVHATFIALAVTFSSTVVVVKMLEYRGEISSRHGRMAVGILLVQDVVVALVLTMLAGIGDSAGTGTAALASALAGAFGGTILLAVFAALAARWVLPRLFGWLGRSPEAVFVWSLSWCFLLVLAAHEVHLSVELGAFIAGVALAQLPHHEDLVFRVEPLVDFFLALFFVSLGIRLEPGAASGYIGAIAALTVFVIVIKPVLLMALLPRFGQKQRTSFLSSLFLGQISEFSFIVAALGFAAGLIDQALLSVIGVTGLLTIGISASLIGLADRIYGTAADAGLLRPFGAAPDEGEGEADALRDHVIVVGMNSLGRRLVADLLARGRDVLALDMDPEKLRRVNCRTLAGDAEHGAVLDEAGLTHSALLVSTLQIEDTNRLLAFRARAAGVPASIHAFDSSVVAELEDIGIAHLMVSKHDGIRQLAERLHALQLID